MPRRPDRPDGCRPALPSPWRRLRRRGLAALLALLVSAPAWAHPDTLMKVRLRVGLDHGRVAELDEAWSFDAAFSGKLLDDYDRDRDGAFDAAERARMREALMGHLADAHFFTYAWDDGRRLTPLTPSGFRARVDDGTVTLVLGLELPAPTPPGALRLELKDPSYVVGVEPVEDAPVVFRGAAAGRCTARLDDAPQDAYFGGAVVPRAITLDCGDA